VVWNLQFTWQDSSFASRMQVHADLFVSEGCAPLQGSKRQISAKKNSWPNHLGALAN